MFFIGVLFSALDARVVQGIPMEVQGRVVLRTNGIPTGVIVTEEKRTLTKWIAVPAHYTAMSMIMLNVYQAFPKAPEHMFLAVVLLLGYRYVHNIFYNNNSPWLAHVLTIGLFIGPTQGLFILKAMMQRSAPDNI